MIELVAKHANTNIQNARGDTVLHHAISTGNVALVSILLENKANPLIANRLHNMKPISYVHMAKTYEDQVQIIKLLMKYWPKNMQSEICLQIIKNDIFVAGLKNIALDELLKLGRINETQRDTYYCQKLM